MPYLWSQESRASQRRAAIFFFRSHSHSERAGGSSRRTARSGGRNSIWHCCTWGRGSSTRRRRSTTAQHASLCFCSGSIRLTGDPHTPNSHDTSPSDDPAISRRACTANTRCDPDTTIHRSREPSRARAGCSTRTTSSSRTCNAHIQPSHLVTIIPVYAAADRPVHPIPRLCPPRHARPESVLNGIAM